MEDEAGEASRRCTVQGSAGHGKASSHPKHSVKQLSKNYGGIFQSLSICHTELAKENAVEQRGWSRH